MASIKLGSIVTQIAGSVGGTTFRRSRYGSVMFNKQKGRSKSLNASNTAISRLQSYLQGWSSLSQSDRDNWDLYASNFERTNKFGEVVRYSGRELYVSIRHAIFGTAIPLEQPNDISNTVRIPVIGGFNINPGSSFEVAFDNSVTGSWVAMQVQELQTSASRPLSKRYRTIFKTELTGASSYDFTNDVRNETWFNSSGNNIVLWFYYINSTGWRGDATPIKTTT